MKTLSVISKVAALSLFAAAPNAHAQVIGQAVGILTKDVPTAEILTPETVPLAEILPAVPPVVSRAAQLEAVRRHPELARSGSPFNREFIARMKRYEIENPVSLQNERWPVLLADEVARAGFESILVPSRRLSLPSYAPGTPAPTAGVRLVSRAAVAPADAPSIVHAATAAGNLLQTKPYKWGGGHGCTEDTGYDCSGSVSYVLKKAGLLDRALTSSGFVSYGKPGPGRYITIYAKSGHVFMSVCGVRLDTGGHRGRNEKGPRWSTVPRCAKGFVMRHPAGL